MHGAGSKPKLLLTHHTMIRKAQNSFVRNQKKKPPTQPTNHQTRKTGTFRHRKSTPARTHHKPRTIDQRSNRATEANR
ncbi:hypothetical protein DM01DRAFT_1221992 [Hesseltinella vesiculosa]|uniref:Uncharacterized protein n=1 Tax=Hesseltinella vesiculosa TaxID=101127 RepID=A0A1X2GP44_9FUNG|nr:hypothetical protein DM01DRAFT_1221992 [Hesseltinella vesiculosa]